MSFVSDYSSIFSQEYLASFDTDFQAIGKLSSVINPTRMRMGVVGSSYNVARGGTLDMVPYTNLQGVIPANPITVDNVNVTFTPRVVKSYVGDLEQQMFVPQAMGMLAYDQALAVSRFIDYIIISGLNQAAYHTDITATTGLNIDVLKEAARVLGAANVTGNKYLLMHVNDFMPLLGQTEFTASNFTSAQPLTGTNTFNYEGTFLGFKIITLGDVISDYDQSNLGLPITSGVRTCFAFSDLALTYGRQGDMMHGYYHQPTNFVSEIATLLSIGCMPYAPKGIVKLLVTEE